MSQPPGKVKKNQCGKIIPYGICDCYTKNLQVFRFFANLPPQIS